MRSTVQQVEPSFKGKVAFIYLVLNVPDEKALAEKLGSATPTTLILVNRAGKVTEIKKGLQEKEIISGKVSALLK